MAEDLEGEAILFALAYSPAERAAFKERLTALEARVTVLEWQIRYILSQRLEIHMSAQPSEPYESIPRSELRRLRAVEHHASDETLDAADMQTTMQDHQKWVNAGRPGAIPHEVMRAELLGEPLTDEQKAVLYTAETEYREWKAAGNT